MLKWKRTVLFRRKSNLFLIFLLVFSGEVFASYFPIIKLHNRTQVLAEIPDEHGLIEQSMVVIMDEADRVIAIGKIRSIDDEARPKTVKVELAEVLDNNVIMIGDRVAVFDKEFIKSHKIPGFNSLTLGGGNRVSAQYKELAYFGVFTSEGHTLDKKEFLISPFQFQYGITDNFGFKVVNALWFDGYVNGGLKYRAVHNKHAKITINGLGAYKVQKQDWIAQAGGVITLPSNSKFQSHFMGNFIFDPQSKESRATDNLNLFRTSDIRSITEYITDDWNRVLYGPVYNVQLQTFGGTVSYMWIWSMFHMSLGVATRDFTNLSFGSDSGYYYVYDFFLRF